MHEGVFTFQKKIPTQKDRAVTDTILLLINDTNIMILIFTNKYIQPAGTDQAKGTHFAPFHLQYVKIHFRIAVRIKFKLARSLLQSL